MNNPTLGTFELTKAFCRLRDRTLHWCQCNTLLKGVLGDSILDARQKSPSNFGVRTEIVTGFYKWHTFFTFSTPGTMHWGIGCIWGWKCFFYMSFIKTWNPGLQSFRTQEDIWAKISSISASNRTAKRLFLTQFERSNQMQLCPAQEFAHAGWGIVDMYLTEHMVKRNMPCLHSRKVRMINMRYFCFFSHCQICEKTHYASEILQSDFPPRVSAYMGY